MIVTNPTKERLEVQIAGTKYFIEPESDLAGVPEEAANYWQVRLHSFIKISPEIAKTPQKVVEDKTDLPPVDPVAPVVPVVVPKVAVKKVASVKK